MFNPSKYLSLLLFCVFQSSTSAEGMISYQVSGKDVKPAFQLNVKESKLRFSDNPETSILYDQLSNSITFVDLKYKEYTTLTADAIDKATKQIDQAMKESEKQMEKASKDMTAQQQTMMKQGKFGMTLMGGMSKMMKSQSIPKSYIESFFNGKEAGYECTNVDVFQSGVKVEQLCVVDPSILGLSKGDSETIKAFLKITEKIDKSNLPMMGFKSPDIQTGGHGLPILIKTLGKKSSSLKLKKVELTEQGDAQFEIPTRYTETQIALPTQM